MATNYDVHFLRILVEQRRVNADQARQCLTWIDAAGAPAPTAYQMAVQRGLVDAGVARVTHVRVMAHFKESGEQVSLVSSEAAQRTVSGEGNVAGQRPSAPAGNYFDLSAAGDNLEGYALGPLVAQGACYSEFQGSGPQGAARILTLSPRFDEHPALLKEVTQELRAWLGFRHAHGSGPERLGRTHARDGRPSQLVVAYPATAGQTLSDFVAEHGAVEADEALDAVLDACDLLAAAHPKGLRVGDVRSGNLVFDGERSRFRDLGLARAHAVAGGFARYGVPFGDPNYLAPEVIQEQIARPTPASDVYALGILFYELICGRLPFVGSPAGILEAHLSDALPPPPVDVDFSSVTAGVVLRMTAKAAEERAQDAVSLLAALRDFRAGRPFRIVVGPPELPSGAGPISADEWSEASNKRAAQGAQDWTESMIDRAPIVGPSDLEPIASGVIFPSDQRLSGRLPRRLLQLGSDLDAPIAEDDRPGADLSSQSDLVVPDSADRLDALSSDRLEPVADAPPRAPEPKPEPAGPPVRIADKLGRGAIGATYEGKAQDHPDPVVLKVVSRKFAQHPEILETIRTDVSAAQTLRHVNVVPVLDMIETEGREVIVSERSSGTVLRALLKGQRRLPIDEALALVRDIARALEAGVRAGFSHGDVRPEKIYVEDTRARLADFGHARGACLGAGLGKYGMSFGHPFYLAPEILQKRLTQPTLQTDLYALGVVFYEALCGARPFNEPGIKKNLLAHLKTPVPAPPRDVSLPQSLADALLRMTAKDPSERYASVEEFMDTLDGCLEASMASADLLSDASGASASAFTVEEFDPTASATGELARVAWGERSQEAARPRAGWSKTKLRQAEKAGPEWSSDDGEAADQDRLYKDLERGGAAVRSGPGKRRSSAGGAAKTLSAKQGGAPKGKSKAPLLAGGLVLCLALVGGGLALGGKEPGKTEPAASPSAGGGKARPDPGVAASKAKAAEESAQEQARQAIATYQERGASLLRAEDHQALAGLKTECFPGKLMSRPEVREAVAAFEAKVKDARAKRFLAAKRVYDSALLRGDLKVAERALAKLPADAAADALRQKVRSALEREEREFDVFANASKRPVDRLERLLERNLRGWDAGGGRAYESGGVIVSYRKAALLLQDLRVLRGAAPESSSRGLALVGSRRSPGVYAWKPTLSGVLGLTAVLSLDQGARFALVFGLNKAGTGKGVALPRGTPVTLGRREVGGAEPLGKPTDLKVEVRFAPQGAQVQASVTVQRGNSMRTTVSFARSELQGGLGFALHGKAWIRSLRIEGVVDPTYR